MDSPDPVDCIAVLAVILLLAVPATAQQITAPYTITAPGTYTVGSDCRAGESTPDCTITISAPDVTLDGGGHVLLGSGIVVESSSADLSGVTIRNIWIEGAQTGILLSGTEGARISGVTIVESVSNGLNIFRSNDSRVEDSVFLKNVDFIGDPVYMNAYLGGILLEGAENVRITGCSFEDHNNAIVLMGTKETTISSNYFHNTRDIIYHSAEGTKIFDNYLSVIDITTDDTSNTLNTTLRDGVNIIGGNRMGGNYWYNDKGTGYSQTCVDDNHSGICDKPYEISSPSGLDKTMRTDNYPLCGPVASGKPAHPVITQRVVHTIPTDAVYTQISPAPSGTTVPVTTAKKAAFPCSYTVMAVMIAVLIVGARR